MKTFEEAMQVMIVRVDSANSLKGAYDSAMKYSPIAAEAQASPMTKTMVDALDEMFGVGGCDCEACVLRRQMMVAAFLGGLRVGIEMEKQELEAGVGV